MSIFLTNWLFMYCLVQNLDVTLIRHSYLGNFFRWNMIWWPWRQYQFHFRITNFINKIYTHWAQWLVNIAKCYFPFKYVWNVCPFRWMGAMKKYTKIRWFCFCSLMFLLLVVLLLIDRMINVFNFMHFSWVWTVHDWI